MADSPALFSFYDLKDRIIVLTGAANGIGRVLALGLAQQGCQLILIDKDARRLEEVDAQTNSLSTLVCDLADSQQRINVARKIDEIAPVVDGLIHNAGIDPRKKLEDTRIDFFRHVMATNVEPAIEITRELLPNIRRSRAGRIILVGSLTFEVGTALLGSYVASKGAIVGLTRSFAHELGQDGITVNCISPGAIEVEKVHEIRKQSIETDDDNTVIDWQAVKRPLVPADLLGITCLLLSQAGSAITGQVIQVEGGITHPIASAELQSKYYGEHITTS